MSESDRTQTNLQGMWHPFDIFIFPLMPDCFMLCCPSPPQDPRDRLSMTGCSSKPHRFLSNIIHARQSEMLRSN